MKKAVFLDRDGVINKVIWNEKEKIWDSPYQLDEFELLPGVGEAIRTIQKMGYLTLVVSNQPGIAKGKCDAATMNAIREKMKFLLKEEGVILDGIYYCLHHPDSVVPELKVGCECRKPKPGLLIQGAAEHQVDLKSSYMVGDHEKDMKAGQRAGCTTIYVGKSAGESPQSNHAANDLPSAVAFLRKERK